MSKSSSTLVAFDEVRKETKNGILPFKMEKFVRHILEIDPDKDYGMKRGKGKDILKRLRTHNGNAANGGNVFWEVDQNAIDSMEVMSGKMVAREPDGGITSELFDQLQDLHGAIEKYDKDMHELLVDEACLMFELFSVKGLPKPEKTYDQLRFKARLVEFFSILKERKIWEPLEEN